MRRSFDNPYRYRTVVQRNRHASVWTGDADGGDHCASSVVDGCSNTPDTRLIFTVINSITLRADFTEFLQESIFLNNRSGGMGF